MASQDDDLKKRMAAFEHVRRLSDIYDYLSSEQIRKGFIFEGKRIPLVNPQRGIFKPRDMQSLLSIRTVVPKQGRRVWYDDQVQAHRQIFRSEESVDYSFMGKDPDATDNRWLREAYEQQTPIIYFLGIAPTLYQALVPAFITGWDRHNLRAQVSFGLAQESKMDMPKEALERRYALTVVKRRLHQASFREAVISAYQHKCAFSGLPEQRLLDAAHIISDGDEEFGQPVVPNGLPLTKIHHAAFDKHLIGLDPDFKLHVSERLLELRDGPLLEALKQLDGKKILLPKREQDQPDQDRLAQRFEEFKLAA